MLEIKDLKKSFDGRLLLDIKNMSFKNTGLYILGGKNGTGKTTLFNLISKRNLEYDGQILFNKKDIRNLVKKENENYLENVVSYLTQDDIFVEKETVINNLLFLNPNANNGIALNCLKEVGLFELKDQVVENLSTGERRRLTFAFALFKDSEIILLDEITNNLDQKNENKILDLIQKLAKDKLVIFITHEKILNKLKIKATQFTVQDNFFSLSDASIIDKTTTVCSPFKMLGILFKANKNVYNIIFFSILILLTLLISFASINSYALDNTYNDFLYTFTNENYEIMSYRNIDDGSYYKDDNSFLISNYTDNAYDIEDIKTQDLENKIYNISFLNSFEKHNIDLLIGRLPLNNKEVLLPSLVIDNIIASKYISNASELINRKFATTYTIVGVYKSYDHCFVSKELLDYYATPINSSGTHLYLYYTDPYLNFLKRSAISLFNKPLDFPEMNNFKYANLIKDIPHKKIEGYAPDVRILENKTNILNDFKTKYTKIINISNAVTYVSMSVVPFMLISFFNILYMDNKDILNFWSTKGLSKTKIIKANFLVYAFTILLSLTAPFILSALIELIVNMILGNFYVGSYISMTKFPLYFFLEIIGFFAVLEAIYMLRMNLSRNDKHKK